MQTSILHNKIHPFKTHFVKYLLADSYFERKDISSEMICIRYLIIHSFAKFRYDNVCECKGKVIEDNWWNEIVQIICLFVRRCDNGDGNIIRLSHDGFFNYSIWYLDPSVRLDSKSLALTSHSMTIYLIKQANRWNILERRMIVDRFLDTRSHLDKVKTIVASLQFFIVFLFNR